MKQKLIAFVFLTSFSFLNLTVAQDSKIEIKLASEIQWQALNPARGDKSPQAGTIWGDQTKDGASGFLVKFVDGFSSPPHIHNVTYRGIVLGGGLHNDDREAEPMWMGAGSYWTQPAGEAHITSARGSSIGYVEIQSGPYLVKSVSEAFDNGERPINIALPNIVWLNADQTNWIRGEDSKAPNTNVQMAFMWGQPNQSSTMGTMVKLPPGFQGKLDTAGSNFKVVVIKGQLNLHRSSGTKNLAPGSYFGSASKSTHKVSCRDECTIYVRSDRSYTIATSK